MPRKCTICADKNRCAIDQCVVKGEPIRRIASHFGVGEKSLERHVKAGHVSKAIESAANDSEKKRGLDLLACAQEIYEIATGSAKDARAAKQFGAVGSCLAPAAKVLEVLKKGEPEKTTTTESSLLSSLQADAKETFKDDVQMGQTKP